MSLRGYLNRGISLADIPTLHLGQNALLVVSEVDGTWVSHHDQIGVPNQLPANQVPEETDTLDSHV